MIKVIDNTKISFVFGSLAVGTTFKFEGAYYMKLEKVELIPQFGEYNAVILTTGALSLFDDDEIVTPFNCELIVL